MATESARDGSAVYIVDDEADYRFLVQQVFTHYMPQYRVQLFSDGETLIHQLTAGPTLPALILLDMNMPGFSGHQTLSLLKQKPILKSIPVVIMTSSSSAQEIQSCYEAGANSCLAKPIGLEPMQQRLALVCHYWMDTNRPFQA